MGKKKKSIIKIEEEVGPAEQIKNAKGRGKDRLEVPKPSKRHGTKKGKKGYDRKKGKDVSGNDEEHSL